MDKLDTSSTASSSTSTGQWNLQSSAAEMEEKVMKRRLLIDGANHDKRIVGLTKGFVSFCNIDDDTTEEAKLYLTRLISQLRQTEFDAKKNYTEVSKIWETKEMYGKLKVDTKVEIEKTKKMISETGLVLQEGREHQAKMKQSDALTRLLLQQSDSKSISEQKERAAQDLQLLEEKHSVHAMALKRKSDTLNALVCVFDLVEDAIQDEVAVPGERLEMALYRQEFYSGESGSSYTDSSPVRSECNVEVMEMEETQCLPSVIEVGECPGSPSPGYLSDNNENSSPEAPDVFINEDVESTTPGVRSRIGDEGGPDLMDEVTLMGFFKDDNGEYSAAVEEPGQSQFSVQDYVDFRKRVRVRSDSSSISTDSVSP